MENFIIVLIGIVFGLLISYAGLNKYDTIVGMSVLKDFTVAKTIMLVLGVGSVFLMLEMMGGDAVFHVKPFYLIGTTLGGVIFGIGMSILGYCPGTLPISLGQGSLDAFWGMLGAFAGGIIYTALYPVALPLLGQDFGRETLFTLMGGSFSPAYITVVVVISAAMIFGAFWLHSLDVRNGIPSKRWILTGVGLALLNVVLFYRYWQNRPLGASSFYPYAGDSFTYFTDNGYFASVTASGNWQLWFLLGALIAGFIYALATKSFKPQLIQSRWIHYRGTSKPRRILWAFIGGVILILGARIADGCTSGHIISGGMQFAVSSYLFAIFTFVGFLGTGYFFYTHHIK